MSDLISRSELLTLFNNKNIQITFDLPVEEVLGEDVDLDDFAMLVQDAIQAYRKMVIDTIKNQPTAYSVDKVVDELEEAKHEICLSDEDLEHYQNGIDNAIEIVKQGGVGTETETIRDKAIKWNNNSSKRVPYEFIDYVEGKREIGVSDDVCEWELKNACYTTSIKHYYSLPTSIVKTFNNCPYCGKKIKVVE